MNAIKQMKETATRSKLATLDRMLEYYHVLTGKYPTDLQELLNSPSKLKSKEQQVNHTDQAGELRDAWDNEFIYTLHAKGSHPPYELYSIGPKGKDKILVPASVEQVKE